MSYLLSGTTYPTNVSTGLPGLTAGGQDYVAAFNTVSGINYPIVTSRVFHNVSGIASYTIGAPETELQSSTTVGTASSTTPPEFTIYDEFGQASAKTITVSGVAGAAIINGASSYTITTAYGQAHFVNVTGNVWLAK